MDSKEILARNKSAAPADEGDVHQDNMARRSGVTAMMVLLAALVVYNLLKGLPSESLQTILWAFVGTEALYKYRHTGNKTFRVAGIAGTIAAVGFLASYVISTW